MENVDCANRVACRTQVSYIRTGNPDGPAFGGIQLVLCGDFFQLPPVDKAPNNSMSGTLAYLPCHNSGYAFQAPSWNGGSVRHHQLTKV